MIGTYINSGTNLFGKYISKQKSTDLCITEKCNINCKFCVYKEQNGTRGIKNLDMNIFKKYAESLKNFDYEVSLSGGEPTLELDICANVTRICKENNIVTALITNGWWGGDTNITKFIKEEIKPKWMILSIDKYHRKFIDVNKIKTIIDDFKYDDIIVCGAAISDKIWKNTYSLEKEFGIYVFPQILNIYTGYCKFSNKDMFNVMQNTEIGFRLECDGTLKASCPNGIYACILGNVMTHDVKELWYDMVGERKVIKEYMKTRTDMIKKE